jgi:anti-sigma regulatory factor (Ser/Thr protein kinase)
MKKLSFMMAPAFAGVDRVRSELKGLCDEAYAGPEAASRAEDLRIAATEAMNNAVEHSGADRIEVELIAGDTGMVFRLITPGKKFDPTENVAMPELGDDVLLPEGGFGLAIIRELVDVVRYEYVEGRNILTLEKEISGNHKEETARGN